MRVRMIRTLIPELRTMIPQKTQADQNMIQQHQMRNAKDQASQNITHQPRRFQWRKMMKDQGKKLQGAILKLIGHRDKMWNADADPSSNDEAEMDTTEQNEQNITICRRILTVRARQPTRGGKEGSWEQWTAQWLGDKEAKRKLERLAARKAGAQAQTSTPKKKSLKHQEMYFRYWSFVQHKFYCRFLLIYWWIW